MLAFGNALGRGSTRDMRNAGFSATLVCAGFMAMAGLVFILFRYSLPWLYVSDREVVEIAASLLMMLRFHIKTRTR